eukprot:2645770-Rhodomonas_salina.2
MKPGGLPWHLAPQLLQSVTALDILQKRRGAVVAHARSVPGCAKVTRRPIALPHSELVPEHRYPLGQYWNFAFQCRASHRARVGR